MSQISHKHLLLVYGEYTRRRCLYMELYIWRIYSFPVAKLVEHGASNAKIMGSIPRESKS